MPPGGDRHAPGPDLEVLGGIGRRVRYARSLVRGLTPGELVSSLECWRTTVRVGRLAMVPPTGLADLWWLTRRIETHAIPGALVQCGVWRGGGGAVMARASRRSGRPLWLFDSFAGFPEPGPEDRPGSGIPAGSWTASVEDVREALRRAGVDLDRVSIVPGWFDATLPAAAPAIGSIALLSVDAVLYASVKVSLEALYDGLAAGGIVVIDDYGYWPGCRRAVHEFLAQRAPTARLRSTATNAYWFEKPSPS